MYINALWVTKIISSLILLPHGKLQWLLCLYPPLRKFTWNLLRKPQLICRIFSQLAREIVEKQKQDNNYTVNNLFSVFTRQISRKYIRFTKISYDKNLIIIQFLGVSRHHCDGLRQSTALRFHFQNCFQSAIYRFPNYCIRTCIIIIF